MVGALLSPANEPAFDPPAVLEITVSGFDDRSHPVEVGFVLPGGQSHCTLIRPVPGWNHWDLATEKIHRIPLETVMRHGRDVIEVATRLNHDLQGRTIYCDGWAQNDGRLGMLFDAAGLAPAFTLVNLRTLLTDKEAAFWATLKKQITTEMRLPRHRASADAKILQNTLMRLRAPMP